MQQLALEAVYTTCILFYHNIHAHFEGLTFTALGSPIPQSGKGHGCPVSLGRLGTPLGDFLKAQRFRVRLQNFLVRDQEFHVTEKTFLIKVQRLILIQLRSVVALQSFFEKQERFLLKWDRFLVKL